MLDYAVKLTRTPGDMTKADVEKLRETGLSDEKILSAALVACLFNFMTRLADGLGVDITESRSKFIDSWLTGPARDQAWLVEPKEA